MRWTLTVLLSVINAGLWKSRRLFLRKRKYEYSIVISILTYYGANLLAWLLCVPISYVDATDESKVRLRKKFLLKLQCGAKPVGQPNISEIYSVHSLTDMRPASSGASHSMAGLL